MADAVTACVRALIERGVTRLDQLEVLLGMAGQPELVWDVEAITEAAHMDSTRVTAALDGLARAGLVVRKSSDGPARHQIDRDVDLGALHALGATYSRDRARVVNAFYACNLESLRSYVRGFKLQGPG